MNILLFEVCKSIVSNENDVITIVTQLFKRQINLIVVQAIDNTIYLIQTDLLLNDEKL